MKYSLNEHLRKSIDGKRDSLFPGNKVGFCHKAAEATVVIHKGQPSNIMVQHDFCSVFESTGLIHCDNACIHDLANGYRYSSASKNSKSMSSMRGGPSGTATLYTAAN